MRSLVLAALASSSLAVAAIPAGAAPAGQVPLEACFNLDVRLVEVDPTSYTFLVSLDPLCPKVLFSGDIRFTRAGVVVAQAHYEQVARSEFQTWIDRDGGSFCVEADGSVSNGKRYAPLSVGRCQVLPAADPASR
jgi:hypothetical protein